MGFDLLISYIDKKLTITSGGGLRIGKYIAVLLFATLLTC